jgi:hypothetical protein
MQELTAIRATNATHRCRCILLAPDLVELPGSHCEKEVDPDSPFCNDCETRHPEVDHKRVQVFVEKRERTDD